MARVLVKKNVAKAVRNATNQPNNPEELDPGHMRLYSYYKPSLKAGLYGIEARQTVNAADNRELKIWNYKGEKTDLNDHPKPVLRQRFQVQAPQFNIDPKSINTFYPPSGHLDDGRILPHIVFNDPHVPWMREAGVSYSFLSDPIDFDPVLQQGRNLVPWMAVVVFDPEELFISDDEAISVGLKNGGVPAKTIASYDAEKLPANGAFQMTVGEYFTNIPKHRIYYEAGYAGDGKEDLEELRTSTDMTSVIFPKKSLVKSILGSKNTPNVSDSGDRILESQKMLAHVRHVNTTGFPDAGFEDEGYFSVVVSSRTGQVTNTVPKPQVVHLISLEHYDSSLMNAEASFKSLGDDDRVGLISLFSWTYNCVPQSVSFVDTMKSLATDMQVLKPPKDSLRHLKNLEPKETEPPTPVVTAQIKKSAVMLHDRLDKSYTISRWRTPTGEETIALNRGPLVGAPTPLYPCKDPEKWPKLSMTGRDYQIFDREIGIMDLTYSSAWNLGKLAAISDSPFNAALLRFRSLVWAKSSSDTRTLTNNMSGQAEILANTTSAVRELRDLKPTTFAGEVTRISPISASSVAPALTDSTVAPIFTKAIQHSVDRFASTVNGESIYNDFNLEKAANSDWELIHAWISDCLYMAHIPAHYLFPEPSHIRKPAPPNKPLAPNLPPEALRFFFIDHAWLDAFIDGALSCANHLEPDHDSTRLRIKDVYNFYLNNAIHSLEGVSPPVPRFGFVLRSSVVRAIPDLKIEVFCWQLDTEKLNWIKDDSKTRRDPVLRLTKMDDFTILCLLDCLPEEIREIKISQPPHQQRYAIGDAMRETTGLPPNTKAQLLPQFRVRMLYTDRRKAPEGTGVEGIWPILPAADDPLPIAPPDPLPIPEQPDDTKLATYWNQDTRLIQPITIAESVADILVHSQNVHTKGLYTDKVANSCILGLELNDPSYSLLIRQDAPKVVEEFPRFERRLWTGLNPGNIPHESDGQLSRQDLPSAPLISNSNTDPTKINMPKGNLPILPNMPRPPLFHSSPITSMPPFKVTQKPGPGSIREPQFTLQMSVDYRPPPPTPRLMNNNQVCYAPLDFLPTQTTYLYDLLISIRRIRPQQDPNFRLAELRIEMPISPDDIDAPFKNVVREPLLPMGGYHGPGARMTRNQRFVPTLYNSTDSAGKPVFGIKLIPRSGSLDATIVLASNHQTDEATIRLAECPIARVKQSVPVAVAQVDANGKGFTPGKVNNERRGIVKLMLRETYVMSDGSKITMVTSGDTEPGNSSVPIPLVAVKKEGGDNDLYGQEV